VPEVAGAYCPVRQTLLHAAKNTTLGATDLGAELDV
jgi:hypothetical protein